MTGAAHRKVLLKPRLVGLRQDDGFAAVDALVALLILSATLVLCLNGLQTADRLSRIAEETGEATRLAKGVLANPQTSSEAVSGRTGALRWTLTEQTAEGADNLCARTLDARSMRDGRLYRFTTARPCG